MSPRKHEVPDELLGSLLANYKKPEDLIGENGLLKQLTKRLVERALDAEMAEHLGHDKHEPVANVAGNTRNGRSRKTLKGEFGELPIEIPRDRHGSFEPQLIPKHQNDFLSGNPNPGYTKFCTRSSGRCNTPRALPPLRWRARGATRRINDGR